MEGQKLWTLNKQAGGEIFKLGILLWGKFGVSIIYGFYDEGAMVMTEWDLWEEPPMLEARYKVHMDSREKLVVEVEHFLEVEVEENLEVEVEVKVTIIMELDRIE